MLPELFWRVKRVVAFEHAGGVAMDVLVGGHGRWTGSEPHRSVHERLDEVAEHGGGDGRS